MEDPGHSQWNTRVFVGDAGMGRMRVHLGQHPKNAKEQSGNSKYVHMVGKKMHDEHLVQMDPSVCYLKGPEFWPMTHMFMGNQNQPF